MTRRQTVLILLAVAVALLIVLLALPSWFWHPLGYCVGSAKEIRDCKGYNWHSGLEANIAEITLIVGFVSWWLHSRCDRLGCLRHGGHLSADGVHHLCRHCHPGLEPKRPSVAELRRRHQKATGGS